MIKFIRKVIRDIATGRNLEHYITLSLILAIYVLDIFNLASPDVLTNITLAVLALVVFGSLSTRESLEELTEKLNKPQNADNFFWQEKRSFESDFSQAKYIGCVGTTLSRTVRDYEAIFENRLSAGANLRVIVIDHATTAPDQAALRSGEGRDLFLDLLRPTIQRVGKLTSVSERVELGLLPYKPAFGLILIDPDEPYGRIIVEIYPHCSTSLFPTFELKPNRDAHWYGYFRKQFDILWNCCGRQYSGKEVRQLVDEVRGITRS